MLNFKFNPQGVFFIFCCLLLSCSSSKNNENHNTRFLNSPYSPTTGWDYDDYNGVSKPSEHFFGSPPGMVFIPGSMFKMGADQPDVRDYWDSYTRRVTVNSFYLDRAEVTNIAYKEYIDWLRNNFNKPELIYIYKTALPDSLVWRDPLAYNEPLVEEYFHAPAFHNYPVVGVSWKQANEYCLWRTNRVNENILFAKGYILNAPDKKGKSSEPTDIKKTTAKGKTLKNAALPPATSKPNQETSVDSALLSPSWVKNIFDTKSYKIGEYTPQNEPKNKSRKNAINEGILFPEFRLPTEAEWEYAANAQIKDFQPQDKKNKKVISNQELITLRQVSVFGNNNILNYNYNDYNFKRNNGNYAGTLGDNSDNNIFPGNVYSYLPNVFGLYNMLGNVSEWVFDVYRPMSNIDDDDVNPFRGNVFQEINNQNGPGSLRNDKGNIKTRNQNEKEIRDRKNYNVADNINYNDGDKSSVSTYNYGNATLINNHSRVYKGGSWNDRSFWLNPGTRRFLDESQSTATIGFRCAMSYYSSSSQPNYNLR